MLALLLTLAITTADVVVATLPARGNVTVALSPAGKAELWREGTVTRAKVQVERLPAIGTFGAAANTYIVWSISREGFFENMGELDQKGRFEATTRFEQLGIIITAEPHYMVDRPSSALAFRTGNPRNANIRRITVPVETGAYDYSKIQFPPKENVPGAVIQARYALQIAKSVDAGRWAEAELRQAQIVVDTVEEMLKRAAPFDIIWPAANEAIRRSQQAVIVAREKAALVALENSKAELSALRDDKQRLEANIREMAREQDAANNRIQRLESDLATVRRDLQRLGQERDQAAARAQNLERQVAELREKQNSLQENLTIQLREEFFDAQTGELAPAGRDALTRTLNFAALVPGSIRIEGPASEALLQAARQFLVQAGIPQDRILIIVR